MNSINSLKGVRAALIAALLVGVACVSARAEDRDWTGAYVGVNAGAGMAAGHVDDPDCWHCNDLPFHDRLLQAGVNGGYDKQFGSAVLGLGAEISLGDQDHRTTTERTNTGPSQLQVLSKINWTGALLARAGMAVQNALIYVTAGPALAHVEASVTDGNAGTNAFRAVFNGWQPGFKAGVGAEFMVSDHASIRAQYGTLIVADRYAQGIASPPSSGHIVWANAQTVGTIGAAWHF